MMGSPGGQSRGSWRGKNTSRGRGQSHSQFSGQASHPNEMKRKHQNQDKPEVPAKKKNKRDSPENCTFYCETCDRGYKNEEKFKEHNDSHIKCSVDGCPYFAAEKLVNLHFQTQHKTGLAKKIWQLESKEDIDKWVEERKKKFPTTENIARKKAIDAEKIARGEVLETETFSQMGRGRGRGRGQGRGRNNRRWGKFDHLRKDVDNVMDQINKEKETKPIGDKNLNKEQSEDEKPGLRITSNAAEDVVHTSEDKLKEEVKNESARQEVVCDLTNNPEMKDSCTNLSGEKTDGTAQRKVSSIKSHIEESKTQTGSETGSEHVADVVMSKSAGSSVGCDLNPASLKGSEEQSTALQEKLTAEVEPPARSSDLDPLSYILNGEDLAKSEEEDDLSLPVPGVLGALASVYDDSDSDDENEDEDGIQTGSAGPKEVPDKAPATASHVETSVQEEKNEHSAVGGGNDEISSEGKRENNIDDGDVIKGETNEEKEDGEIDDDDDEEEEEAEVVKTDLKPSSDKLEETDTQRGVDGDGCDRQAKKRRKNNRGRNKAKRDGTARQGGQNGTQLSKKRLTLLQRLLAPEIRHERNVILQCVRHIIKTDYLGVGLRSLPPTSSSSTSGSVSSDSKSSTNEDVTSGAGTENNTT